MFNRFRSVRVMMLTLMKDRGNFFFVQYFMIVFGFHFEDDGRPHIREGYTQEGEREEEKREGEREIKILMIAI